METQQQTKTWAEMTDAERQATAEEVAQGMKGLVDQHPDMSIATKERMLGGLAGIHRRLGQQEVSNALLKVLEGERAKA